MADYIFPKELANYDFWMTLRFYQYRIPSGGGQSGAPLANELGTVRLPLPNQLVDHQDIIYAAEEMGLVAGSALQKFQESSGGLNSAASIAAGVAKGLAAEGATNLAGKPGQSILQTQGLAINPFLSVLFKSPAFKKHVMKWTLTPTNEPESRELDQLTKYIRYNQLPSRSPAFGGLVMSYPNIVVIDINHTQKPDINNSNSYWSFKYRPAVIETFAINWSPHGQPAMFAETAAPVSCEITMSLLEIEFWLQEDYGAASTLGSTKTFAESFESIFGGLNAGPAATTALGTSNIPPNFTITP